MSENICATFGLSGSRLGNSGVRIRSFESLTVYSYQNYLHVAGNQAWIVMIEVKGMLTHTAHSR